MFAAGDDHLKFSVLLAEEFQNYNKAAHHTEYFFFFFSLTKIFLLPFLSFFPFSYSFLRLKIKEKKSQNRGNPDTKIWLPEKILKCYKSKLFLLHSRVNPFCPYVLIWTFILSHIWFCLNFKYSLSCLADPISEMQNAVCRFKWLFWDRILTIYPFI